MYKILTDAPQNSSVSTDNVELTEDSETETRVTCVSDGSPGPSYYWTRDNEVVSEGNTLKLPDPITR